MKNDKKVSAEIIETYSTVETFADGSKLILCLISWNGKEPRLELRVIKSNGHFGSGVSFSKKKLVTALKSVPDEVIKQSVDFDDIFKSAEKIDKLRDVGYVTKNGKILLSKKRG